MTLTALNIVSIVVLVVLVCLAVGLYVHLRRAVEEAEGAIDVITLD